eukprot:CAMPEP_0168531080 /NCGR_PEP_ID=MMETSP0405-20121227/15163_1 /TAXON_ID=498012 /ORGANISM="Trichosphaerium sp, Strain Am-I-7 wt" /LENGTH=108 /DNA_ID=CAMNT_0008555671 /DNA_START=54 /DNA_END=380 /DNA_ORIENTATION=+
MTMSVIYAGAGSYGFYMTKSLPSLLGGFGIAFTYLYAVNRMGVGEDITGNLIAATAAGVGTSIMGRRASVAKAWQLPLTVSILSGVSLAFHSYKAYVYTSEERAAANE